MLVEIINARLDIQIVINKQLMRAKRSNVSEEKRLGILGQVKALESVLETIKLMQSELEKTYKLNSRLHVENLKLKEMLVKEQNLEI